MSWLKRIRYSEWLAIISAVVTFAFGLIGGKLFEAMIGPLFDSGTKATLTGVFIVGFLSVTLLLVITVFAHRAEDREKRWLRSIGVPAELLFERTKVNKGKYYLKLVEFINHLSAGDEVLIMSTHKRYNPADDIRDTKARKRARDKYSRLLLKKVREEDVSYQRIVCFKDCPPDVDLASSYIKPWLIDHCREMLEIKQNKPHSISLKISKTLISSDIFVITGKVGTLVVDIYDSQTGQSSTYASLIFHNPPNAQIIDQLRKWFFEIGGDGIPVTKIPGRE